MAYQTWETLINAYQTSGSSAGVALKESTTLTDISPGANTAGQALTLPASFLLPGNILRFTARGIFGCVTARALTLGLYYGGVAGVALAETVAITAPAAATNQAWALEATARIISTGTAGKVLTQGQVIGIESLSGVATSAGVTMLPATAASGNEVAIDTSLAKILTVGAKWGTSSATNTIQCYQWLVECLN